MPDALDLLAASSTGALVIALTNPLDCLKQRWQVSRGGATSIIAFTTSIVKGEGILSGLWLPGLATNCLACSISVGTRIGLYPSLRSAIAGEDQPKSGFGMFVSGLAGGALGYVVAAPLFFATRVAHAEAGLVDSSGILVTGARAGKVPSAPGSSMGLGMLSTLAGQVGVAGLWKGAPVLVARGALLSATQLASYDLTKGKLRQLGLRDGPVVHGIASVAASLTLTTAICPLDVVLTSYQAGHAVGRPFDSPFACARQLVRDDGPSVLLRGWGPLFVRFLPSSVLTFFIYEQARRLLVGRYLD